MRRRAIRIGLQVRTLERTAASRTLALCATPIVAQVRSSAPYVGLEHTYANLDKNPSLAL
jgi:hypothetical protein